MQVTELFSNEALGEMVAAGYVRMQRHPRFHDGVPYVIFNYTDVAAYERVWNPVTEVCRGLIVNNATLEVVARPFRKFFNYGEPGSPVLHMDEGVDVYDKLDGSLGILYQLPDGEYAIATRGSFDSEQARHATKVWQDRYAGKFTPYPGGTYLFEIIYRANRIVCDYGDMDDLVLLGAVDIEQGVSFTPHEGEAIGEWPGPKAEMFQYWSLAAALAAPPRPGKEGFVLRRWHSEDRIKIKQDDYVALHRIITNCTARRIWEYLAVFACKPYATTGTEFLVRKLMMGPADINWILAVGPNWLETFLVGTPEEFRDWVQEKVWEFNRARTLRHKALELSLHLLLATADVPRSAVGGPSREEAKAFAAAGRSHPDFQLLMTMLRGHEIESTIWRELRPAHELPYRAVDESVA
jgi:RNA ligase